MTFKINTTTSISNTPNISFSLLINKPAVMATCNLLANSLLKTDSTLFSGSTITFGTT